MSKQLDKESVRALLATHAVRRDRTFKLTSGGTSGLYVDCKPVMLCHDGIHALGTLLYRLMASSGVAIPHIVAGIPMGGIPLAVAVSLASEGPALDVAIIRDAPKEHGSLSWVEMPAVIRGRNAVLVDDVMTTGGSIVRATMMARDAGLDVMGAFVVIDRQDGGSKNVMDNVGVSVRSLFTIGDLHA